MNIWICSINNSQVFFFPSASVLSLLINKELSGHLSKWQTVDLGKWGTEILLNCFQLTNPRTQPEWSATARVGVPVKKGQRGMCFFKGPSDSEKKSTKEATDGSHSREEMPEQVLYEQTGMTTRKTWSLSLARGQWDILYHVSATLARKRNL